jgi:aminopeptidase N
MKAQHRTLLALAVVLAPGCAASSDAPAPRPSGARAAEDLHSFAEPERVRVTHVALDLVLDFDASRARGVVALRLERADREAPLVLDTRALEVFDVRGADGTPRAWGYGKADEVRGTPMVVTLAPGDETVTVSYASTAGSEAMQWLAPEQTADGTHPFLFTQGQSILTRSWIPLQDSPGVRVTYEAAVKAPQHITVVMSAEQLGQRDGTWRFRMDQPIPPYLIALAAGRLEFRSISKRCGVYAEPSVVEAAARELEDTEDMIRAAEDLFGEYRWGRYDMIVLPPAFPFGGMENPRLTFLTPTMLAGDKSLVALIAHELAHSWSGNLVTNATWRDFWLNEGMTVYFEGRIMEEVYGQDRAEMEQGLGVQSLQQELKELDPRDG